MPKQPHVGGGAMDHPESRAEHVVCRMSKRLKMQPVAPRGANSRDSIPWLSLDQIPAVCFTKQPLHRKRFVTWEHQRVFFSFLLLLTAELKPSPFDLHVQELLRVGGVNWLTRSAAVNPRKEHEGALRKRHWVRARVWSLRLMCS